MIGFLRGDLRLHHPSSIIVDVGGVGYLIRPSLSVLKRYSGDGESVEIFVHTHVRDDQITLFGFLSMEELQLFELLLSVSGVGPKSALAVLAAGTTEEIYAAISHAEVEFFQSVPGVGKKTAQRVIVDLKSKVSDLEDLDLSDSDSVSHRELTAALRSMGFSTPEVKSAVKDVDISLSLEEQIRRALKQI